MISIVKADANDTNKICTLSIQTFQESYGNENTEENMARYIEQHFSEPVIRKELADPNNHFFMIYQNDTLTGYAKLGNNQPLFFTEQTNAIEIERFYILKSFHRQQLGTALMNNIINFAKQNSKELLWLGVWERNDKAIMFYKHHGFIKKGQHDFILGNDVQQDYIMVLTF